MKPLCFIIMPFGKKPDSKGNLVDFDYIYNEFIRKVIENCSLSPVRADEEMIGGIIHKPMYERLILCDYAIADLTTANANVFYELGVRYTAKPFTTFTIFESETKIPFDLVDIRCFPYTYADGTIKDKDEKINTLVNYIEGIKIKKETDSPVYQLLDGISFSHNLSHEKVELLRAQTEFSEALRDELEKVIQSTSTKAEKAIVVKQIEQKSGDKNDWPVSICLDFMLAYRSIECYNEMVDFIESLPPFLKRTAMIREQYGFALNRANKSDEAVKVLEQLIDENGAISETCGILGRVYKDKYNELKSSKPGLASAFLDKAIDTYMMGYKADMRDFYPGVNAVNLLFIKNDAAAVNLAKVVEFSVQTHLENKSRRSFRNIKSNFDDYWPYATLLELAVVQNNRENAGKHLYKCLATPNELWQRKTTAANLEMYGDTREWVKEIISQLLE
ncbi:MAG: TRAFs-binding domain-containing protein [Chitinophagaceae bacterium]